MKNKETPRTVTEQVFEESRDAKGSRPYTWGEVQAALKAQGVKLRKDDIIHVGYDEGFITSDNAVDPCYYISIHRTRPENEEEIEERRRQTEELKKRRFETYLKLKKEFEDGK